MRLLVIRTSAMGDVALTVPVLREMREQHPETEIILLTRKAFSPFFVSVPGIKLFHADFEKRHRGIIGLARLCSDLKKSYRIDYIVDLHDVIRSKLLRLFFILGGVPGVRIRKGRNEKRKLVKGKSREKLKHSVERYRDAFSKAGFDINPSPGPWIVQSSPVVAEAETRIASRGILNIGVAPYAKHRLKLWPEEYMVDLLKMIHEKYNAYFWLFGGREELERLSLLKEKIPGATVISGSLTLAEELAIISKADLMISMDSSNMHMAALSGTKVISIWGATDPLAGFGPWMQPDEYSVRIPVQELGCRPCTVYGKGECRRGDHACMQWLTPDMVFRKIVELKVIQNSQDLKL